MSQARSGELSAELGHVGPNANKACRESGNALGRRVTAPCHCRAWDSPCVIAPDPVVLVGPRTVALTRNHESEDVRDRCPRVEPRHN